MKTITVDENAHMILSDWKEKAKADGIGSPSHSDAIRWRKHKGSE